MKTHERLLLPENLNFAWRKAKKLYRTADGYIDRAEISEFELDLDARLKRIHRQFQQGRYRLGKIRPLPRPKKIKNEAPVDRQYFHIPIDDQVAWIAVVNAIGPELDRRMPSWSYGNRLYRPAWYEDNEEQRSRLEIGPYRHASGHLYRKFQHSWPLFRRHVALSAKAMARGQPPDRAELDQSDQMAAASATADNLPYLRRDFWHHGSSHQKAPDLFCASIDLKQFYPSIHLEAVLQGLTILHVGVEGDDLMPGILKDMLRFQLDKSEMSPEGLSSVEPQFGGKRVSGIPTGLFVAGFLANAAMLPVDTIVNERIERERRVAHFRFVDDHTILARDFEYLCNWISWYQQLLSGTGTEVNYEKCDPESLGTWLSLNTAGHSTRDLSQDAKREAAVRDTKLDGANPTKLLTKTLGQVSAIAATNADLLDDDDLRERLRHLEWLLLADIPEREIRPDTRAAFAAAQIAALAPMLVHDADGLIDEVRSLALLRSHAPPKGSSDTETEDHLAAVRMKIREIDKLRATHFLEENRHLGHCFSLLLQAFHEYPGKARLFYRLHEYCRLTGYKGLSRVAVWIKETRDRNRIVWADYYAGLSLQILAHGLLQAIRSLSTTDGQRSELDAAMNHLEDIAALDVSAFLIPRERESWFHATGRKEFGVTLLAVAVAARQFPNADQLSTKFASLAEKCISMTLADFSEWINKTGRPPGVWAHLTESILSIDEKPSPAWERFELSFSYERKADRLAARRYPEALSDRGWDYFLLHGTQEVDSGWVLDAVIANSKRNQAALSSKFLAFKRASRSSRPPPKGWVTLSDWTEFVLTQCSPFDPRCSEWTALEIVRQIISPVVKEVLVKEDRLDRLHPNNLLIADSWLSRFQASRERAGVSWEQWRTFTGNRHNGLQPVRFRDGSSSIVDYRYFNYQQDGRSLTYWERRLVAVGRLLLGLLRFNHDAPRLWNIRGNEQVIALPRARMFQSLAISSLTARLLESCLSARSAETRTMMHNPDLFGLFDGMAANDTAFDPPPLLETNSLLEAIEQAQAVLRENQLAVIMNQPRQLIPFRLKDFAIATDTDDDESGPHE